jgi:Ca2+-binding RTX toxin-like protein
LRRLPLVVAVVCLALASGSGGAQTARPTCFGLLATLVGSDRDDVMTGTQGPDVIATLDGDDQVEGGGGDDRICTGAGADTFFGGQGNDRLNGGADQDALAGGSGDDLLIGGAGSSDTAFYLTAPGPVRANLETGSATGEGTDTLQELENVAGSQFTDTLVGNAEINVFLGGEGNDTMDGGLHSDAFVGGPGNDELIGRLGDGDTAAYPNAPGPVTVNLATGVATGEGTDRLVQVDDALGSDHNDTLIGDARMNFLIGGRGNDELRAGAGFDVAVFLTGPVTASLESSSASGEGTDRLVGFDGLAGSEAADRLIGDGRQNYLEGRSGGDTLEGGGGGDVVMGKDGSDQLLGGAGDDKLFGGSGDDMLVGGAGSGDAVSYLDSPSAVRVDLAAGRGSGEGEDRLESLEGVSGSLLADQLRGDGRANALSGNAGDDVLVGGAGSDFLGGGEGRNTAEPGPGADYCLDATAPGCEVVGTPLIAGLPDQPPVQPPRRAAAAVSAAPLPVRTSRVDLLRWFARAVHRLDAIATRIERRRPLPFRLPAAVAAPRATASTGAVRVTAEYEYGAEPLCIVQAGRRSTELSPPKLVRPVGDDGRAEEAWWRGTLFKRNAKTGRFQRQARTPWARAQLAGGFVVPGVLLWRDASGARAYTSPVRVRLKRGRYVWKGQIFWVRSGGRIFAPIEPHIIRTRTIRHHKFCDFK